eukprot:scaffold215596_cov40-Cyclotella_meneghiniana.AAC.1
MALGCIQRKHKHDQLGYVCKVESTGSQRRVKGNYLHPTLPYILCPTFEFWRSTQLNSRTKTEELTLQQGRHCRSGPAKSWTTLLPQRLLVKQSRHS